MIIIFVCYGEDTPLNQHAYNDIYTRTPVTQDRNNQLV